MGGTRLPRKSIRRHYVRVARVDWPRVKHGTKREFRATGYDASPVTREHCPTPIIAWCPVTYGPVPDQQIMLCEEAWSERLGEISDDSLAREGFASRKEFVDYWRFHRAGGSKGFKPLIQVRVYRVRPWQDGDIEICGTKLVEHLYGEHLET